MTPTLHITVMLKITKSEITRKIKESQQHTLVPGMFKVDTIEIPKEASV